MTTGNDNSPAVPPYEGRKTEADAEQSTGKDAARTAGATAPAPPEERTRPR